MALAKKSEPALTYAARDSFAFVEKPEAPPAAKSSSTKKSQTAKTAAAPRAAAKKPPKPAIVEAAAPVPAVAPPAVVSAPVPKAAEPVAAPVPVVPIPAAPVPAAFIPPASLPGAAKPAAVPGAMFRDYDALTAFGASNVEAVVEAGTIVAKGFEEIGQSVVDLGQRNLESSVALAKAAFGLTTLRQLVDLQTGFAKESFDRLIAEGTRLSEISFKTADAALQPLKARMAKTIHGLSAPA
jgi:phasin family protein